MRLVQVLLFLLTFALGMVAAANGQECPAGGCEPRPTHEGMDHAAMAARHGEMMAHMEAANARLESLVAEMNAASGDARTDAIAALLTELVAQRKAMCAHMMEMMHGGGAHEEHGEHAEHEKHGEHGEHPAPLMPPGQP